MLELLDPSPILLPVVALVIWTLIIQGWMVITRVPAMNAAKLDAQVAERTSDLAGKLPKEVQWKADNYNHLMEQPTIFCALAIAGLGEGLNLWLAWIYMGSRVVHSIVHGTINKVMLRFLVFAIGSVALLVMAINGAMQLTQ